MHPTQLHPSPTASTPRTNSLNVTTSQKITFLDDEKKMPAFLLFLISKLKLFHPFILSSFHLSLQTLQDFAG